VSGELQGLGERLGQAHGMTDEGPPLDQVRSIMTGGRKAFIAIGQERGGVRDLYHKVLNMPLWGLLALLACAYLVVNVLFALLYLMHPGAISGARSGSFADAFFFSVQTLSTIGYGEMAPRGLYANVLVTAEAFSGLVTIALTTGLIFTRVSKPTARVMFSRVAVITAFDGVPTLMFRAANQRSNQILEAEVMVNIARQITTAEGHTMRSFFDLPAVRARSPLFLLSWTIMHRLDENSPLYGVTPESLRAEAAEILVVLSGMDDTFAQRIHARHAYASDEILWDKQFEDVLSLTDDGRRIVDYRKFHDVRDVARDFAPS
jgi:inward rectifier potassium channel